MNNKFELNRSYAFDFSRREIKNGDTYFYLKYEGANTMPEYENTSLKFRVKALGFQKDWTDEEIRERMPLVNCLVHHYCPDLYNGELPLFPYLIIDRYPILKSCFETGQAYQFTVEGKASDSNTGCEYFSLRDEKIQQQHRYYPKKDVLWNIGDKVELEVTEISDKAYLKLSLTPKENLKVEIANLKLVEDLSDKRENESLEFKSSFVYTVENKQDIDKQLGKEIMQQLAAFMNSQGGTVCLGYRNDGSIRGINEDVQLLNTSSTDEFNGTYEETIDGVELKMRNVIERVLGVTAATLVGVEFYKTSSNQLVCFLKAPCSSTPIYLNNNYLYVRSGNSCRRLSGDDMTKFFQNRYRFQKHIETTRDYVKKFALAVCGENKMDENKDVVNTNLQLMGGISKQLTTCVDDAGMEGINSKEESFFKVLTLYVNGDVSYQDHRKEGIDILFNILLPSNVMNEKGRLVFIYGNGCVNVIDLAAIIKKRFFKLGERYKNGFNTKGNLLKCCVCKEDDFLWIYTDKKQNPEVIPVIEIAKYRLNKDMNAKGKKVLKEPYSQIINIEVFSKEFLRKTQQMGSLSL